jgi:hypothetical protein
MPPRVRSMSLSMSASLSSPWACLLTEKTLFQPNFTALNTFDG